MVVLWVAKIPRDYEDPCSEGNFPRESPTPPFWPRSVQGPVLSWVGSAWFNSEPTMFLGTGMFTFDSTIFGLFWLPPGKKDLHIAHVFCLSCGSNVQQLPGCKLSLNVTPASARRHQMTEIDRSQLEAKECSTGQIHTNIIYNLCNIHTCMHTYIHTSILTYIHTYIHTLHCITFAFAFTLTSHHIAFHYIAVPP